jgi:hypothetical protein
MNTNLILVIKLILPELIKVKIQITDLKFQVKLQPIHYLDSDKKPIFTDELLRGEPTF